MSQKNLTIEINSRSLFILKTKIKKKVGHDAVAVVNLEDAANKVIVNLISRLSRDVSVGGISWCNFVYDRNKGNSKRTLEEIKKDPQKYGLRDTELSVLSTIDQYPRLTGR